MMGYICVFQSVMGISMFSENARVPLWFSDHTWVISVSFIVCLVISVFQRSPDYFWGFQSMLELFLWSSKYSVVISGGGSEYAWLFLGFSEYIGVILGVVRVCLVISGGFRVCLVISAFFRVCCGYFWGFQSLPGYFCFFLQNTMGCF